VMEQSSGDGSGTWVMEQSWHLSDGAGLAPGWWSGAGTRASPSASGGEQILFPGQSSGDQGLAPESQWVPGEEGWRSYRYRQQDVPMPFLRSLPLEESPHSNGSALQPWFKHSRKDVKMNQGASS